jgi:16S rRNA G966 N2-methylase RsmD
MRQGVRPKSFWGSEIRERIAVQVEHIRHWRIIEGDYTAAPDGPATWFVDPPYSNPVGRRYRFSEVDYVALGEWVKGRDGHVIVCENEGATWLPFKPFRKTKANESKHGGKVSHEAIYETACAAGEVSE